MATKKTRKKSKLTRGSTSNHPSDFMPKLHKPKLAKPKPLVSVSKIVAACDPDVKKRSRGMPVKKIQVMQRPQSKLVEPDCLIYRVDCYNTDNKHTHQVTVFLPEGEFKPSAPVRVDCSCPYHVFKSEYALAKRYGAAYIWRCNGEPPVQTNPSLSLLTCKHVMAAFRALNNRRKQGNLSSKPRKNSPKISSVRD